MAKQHWILFGSGVAIGSTLMVFLDPQRGARRRALTRDRTLRAFRHGADSVRKTARDLGNRSRGLYAVLGSRLRGEELSDDKLVARVRSSVGHHAAHGRTVVVEAHRGTVTLRGPVAAAERDGLVAAVAAVRGVKKVVDNLEIRNGHAAGRRWLGPAASILAGTAAGALTLAGLKRRGLAAGAAVGSVSLGLLATSRIARRQAAAPHHAERAVAAS